MSLYHVIRPKQTVIPDLKNKIVVKRHPTENLKTEFEQFLSNASDGAWEGSQPPYL